MPRTIQVGPDDHVVVRVPLSHAERGRLGAKAKWGDVPRVIRLDGLTADQRRLVLAMVEMAKSTERETAPVGETSGTVEAEVRRGSVERSAA